MTGECTSSYIRSVVHIPRAQPTMYDPVRGRDPTQAPPAASLGGYQLNQPSGVPLPPAWEEGRRRSSGVEMMPPPRGLGMYRVGSGDGEGECDLKEERS